MVKHERSWRIRAMTGSKYTHHKTGTKTMCEEVGRAKIIGIPKSVSRLGNERPTCPECLKEIAFQKMFKQEDKDKTDEHCSINN